ncbi:hypothetical protein E1176_02300 [Fulvivirga sp. RKSG066]|uniref:tetratricopeptide repeat protein n=1 Tax=Fulvivirga aurantia TaxID=2529383 RepID=UPI0012BCA3EB|nr:hypothetical protein [Fulvivirga aurantia]MTI19845.1 hypothetical protein [Fulvivirga aurantia]
MKVNVNTWTSPTIARKQMMMKNIIISLIILCPLLANGQSEKDKNKAEEIGLKAIKIVDEGDYNKAVTLLLKAQKLDPNRFDYPYEIGYALYQSKLYEQTIKWLKPLMSHPDATDVLYQLLGNAYDELEHRDSAIWSYKKGIEKYPHSGKLFLESGIVEYRKENYDRAVQYWEDGIRAEPNFSSNYFWLGRILSDSNFKIWSLMYGEIFMFLEPNTNRTQEMSKILYNVYNTSIEFETDTSSQVSLNNQIVIIADEFAENPKIPFELNFEALFTLACAPDSSRTKKDLDIYMFSEIRQDFSEYWNQKDFEPNAVFDFHKSMIKNAVFDAYNYWLLMMGDIENYKSWFNSNGQEFEEFAAYFNDNRPTFNNKNLVIRK